MANGSAGHPYTPCIIADTSEYDAACEPLDADYVPNQYDQCRARGQSYEYLVEKPLAPGELHVAARGNQLAIAIGHVSTLNTCPEPLTCT